jgi:hypothetical protein
MGSCLDGLAPGEEVAPKDVKGYAVGVATGPDHHVPGRDFPLDLAPPKLPELTP